MARQLSPAPLSALRFTDGFWKARGAVNRRVTLAIESEQCERTGRFAAWDFTWQPGQGPEPHIFWDSDIAKWIEAVAYSLTDERDATLEAKVDELIDKLVAHQDADGYFNSHFQQVRPEKRWMRLISQHELYCAGHLFEAAVAYYEATGKRKLLDAMCRFADHIGQTFGSDPGQIPGYPGHEEIELALVKLARATGEQRYLQLARYFVDQRGAEPFYFDIEAEREGFKPQRPVADYCQAHAPVRAQASAEGHAVRAGYLYAAMADVAAETDDPTLLAACHRLWRNIVDRRIYVTGGIGSAHQGERFTFDYDLPNESAYAETCAAIALVFFAHRLLQIAPKAEYADVMERALYNGVISGVNQAGDRFFYCNPLTVYPPRNAYQGGHWHAVRQEWFGCACCPPNLARLLASLPQYALSTGADSIWLHLYAGLNAELEIDGAAVQLRVETEYPWDGKVCVQLETGRPAEFTLCLRRPGWAESATVEVNGETQPVEEKDGYLAIRRTWRAGDLVCLEMPMPVRVTEAHPRLRQDCGRVALERGPLVYCVEEADNGADLADLRLPVAQDFIVERDGEPFPGAVKIRGTARRRDLAGWGDRLYGPAGGDLVEQPFTAIPYYLWANREPGEMAVWLLRDRD